MMGDQNKDDKRSPAGEQRGILTDAATAFVLGAAGGAGTATGVAAVQAVGNVFSSDQAAAEPPAEVVLPPGVNTNDS